MEYPDGSKWSLSDMECNPPNQSKDEDAFKVMGLLVYSISKYDCNK